MMLFSHRVSFGHTPRAALSTATVALATFSLASGVSVANAAPTTTPTTVQAVAATAAPTAVPAIPAAPTAEEVAAAAAAEQAARDAAWHTPVGSYLVSSYYAEQRGDGPHLAVDLAGAEGQDVLAARSGTVTSAGWQDGYGFTVEIDHGDGHTTLYGHLMTDPYVAVGQHVSGGQPIGALGTTGYSTGPHLHLELEFHGASVDPMTVIPIPDSTM